MPTPKVKNPLRPIPPKETEEERLEHRSNKHVERLVDPAAATKIPPTRILNQGGKTPTQIWLDACDDQLRQMKFLSEFLQDHPPKTAAEACLYYHRMRIMMEPHEETGKALQELIDRYKYTVVPESMGKENVTTITLDIGPEKTKYRFTVNMPWRASVLEGMKEKAMGWLRKTKHGDIISETINASTLSAFAKDYHKTTGKDLPPDIFKAAPVPTASITKV